MNIGEALEKFDKLSMNLDKLVLIARIAIPVIRSLDEAVRKSGNLPDPEPLPEEWDDLVNGSKG